MKVKRKLTTILAADAVGYSRAMDTDEVLALSALHAARRVFEKFIERHEGRIVNTAGDGLIAEFASVVEAVQCAIEVQQELNASNNKRNDALRFRIGIHLGDVMIDGSDLLGEGVNLASRLESMAEPGGVLISRQVYDQVQHKLAIGFEYLGEKRPKNFVEDVAVYQITLGKKRRSATHTVPKEKSVKNNNRPRTQPLNLKHGVIRNAKLFGIGWTFLLAVDITTGASFWAHWPGLVMAVLLGLQAMPLFVKGKFTLPYFRGVLVICALGLINLFTWTGYPWVLWPAGVLVTVELLRRTSANKTS